MQRSQLEGPVGEGDRVLGPQGPRAPVGHGLVEAAASRGNQETRGPASAGAGAGGGRQAGEVRSGEGGGRVLCCVVLRESFAGWNESCVVLEM